MFYFSFLWAILLLTIFFFFFGNGLISNMLTINLIRNLSWDKQTEENKPHSSQICLRFVGGGKDFYCFCCYRQIAAAAEALARICNEMEITEKKGLQNLIDSGNGSGCQDDNLFEARLKTYGWINVG